MLGKTFRMPFRLLGIPVYADWTFLIILPLLAWLIGRNIVPTAALLGIAHPQALAVGYLPWILGLISAVGLFVGVVLHELGHSVIARQYGVEVKNITLWFLGGVAQFEEMPRRRGAEAVISVAGPMVSFILGGICWAIAWVIPASAPAAGFVFRYLAWMNLVLGVFNLLPAMPLDGGRVLRSLLALRMPYVRATQLAGSVAKFLAVLLGLVGLFYNPYLLLIAFFIFLAVNAETRQTVITELLDRVNVRELMSRPVITVPPELTVADLKHRMLQDHHLAFPVRDSSGQLVGIVALRQLQDADPAWTVGQVMMPQVPTIREEDSARRAFELMSSSGLGRLIVTDAAGQMVGIITKTDLVHAIEVQGVGRDGQAANTAPIRDHFQDMAQT